MIISFLKRSNYILLFITLSLITFGMTMIYSSSFIIATTTKGDGYFFLKRQLIFSIIGLILMLIFSKINYNFLKKITYPLLCLSFIMLIILIIPGFGVKKNGATRWINLGFFAFQVVELVKFSVILFLAHYFSKKKKNFIDFFTEF